jgi:hypothetical protein
MRLCRINFADDASSSALQDALLALPNTTGARNRRPDHRDQLKGADRHLLDGSRLRRGRCYRAAHQG